MEKILLITGGGDAPGLNQVIRSATLRAIKNKWNVFGSTNSFHGILAENPTLVALTPQNVLELHSLGGTILGTNNKDAPSNFPSIDKTTGKRIFIDRSTELVEKIKSLGITSVINIGGDGSQRISYNLFQKGLNIIGIPKTIDNDIPITNVTFGFQTAVATATDALDKLMTTAKSHRRVMILEVMGRNTGWIALNSGIAGGADIILIPEIPFHLDDIVKKIKKQTWRNYTIIVVAEGAFPVGGSPIYTISNDLGHQYKRFGGIGKWLTEQLEKKIEKEVRYIALGHLQRGGTPNAFDRIISSQFGVKAIELIEKKKFGVMTSYHDSHIKEIPFKEVVKENKYVNLNSDIFRTGLGLNISFGAKIKNRQT